MDPIRIESSIILMFFVYFSSTVYGQCFFPGELQGYWATQAAPDASDAPNEYNISYSMVQIEHDFISTWGHCHKKMDDNIILADRNRSRTNSIQCFRCFRLVVASFNVAALVSSGLKSCFPTVQDALRSCPTTERGAAHIVLYKVRSLGGDSAIEESQCPLSGIYHFSYEKGFERRYSERCEQPTSEMSNCHLGYKFNLRFSECNFNEPRGGNWHCLGSWSGLDGQKYTTMLDMDAREGDGRPKYKCGIYEEEPGTGRVYLAFSRDSTCKNHLHDAHNGFERFVLHSANSAPLPRLVHEATCHFPKSLRGVWHNTVIRKRSIKFRDANKFVTYQMHCVKDIGDASRYVVYARTNCGKVEYRCIYLKRRAVNILELMLGATASDTVVRHLCDQRQFGNHSTWITQARIDSEVPTRCPIVGTYRGGLPDAPGYCAELYSDCDQPDTMYYAVDDCDNPSAVYEQRQYQCLGQWKEDGTIFALTRRTDIHTYECFVGVSDAEGDVIVFIKEAGSSCSRGIKPKEMGMETIMKEECTATPPRRNFTLQKPIREVHKPPRPMWVPSTSRPTRTWEPITGRPRRRGVSSALSLKPLYPTLTIVLLLILS